MVMRFSTSSSLSRDPQARGADQAGLAERMGVKQAAVSRIESRDDLLLSTLEEYAAAGATHGRIVLRINGIDVELPLDRYRA